MLILLESSLLWKECGLEEAKESIVLSGVHYFSLVGNLHMHQGLVGDHPSLNSGF